MRRIKNRCLDSPWVFAYFGFNSPEIVAITGVLLRCSGTPGISPGVTPDRLSSRSLEIASRCSVRRERERRDAQQLSGDGVPFRRGRRPGSRRGKRDCRRCARGGPPGALLCVPGVRGLLCCSGAQFSGLAPVQGRERARHRGRRDADVLPGARHRVGSALGLRVPPPPGGKRGECRGVRADPSDRCRDPRRASLPLDVARHTGRRTRAL